MNPIFETKGQAKNRKRAEREAAWAAEQQAEQERQAPLHDARSALGSFIGEDAMYALEHYLDVRDSLK